MVVYNSGGYEKVESLCLLEGYVDIYLPDLKFMDPALGTDCADAPDYFAVASAAILEMVRQTGSLQMGEDGMLRRGSSSGIWCCQGSGGIRSGCCGGWRRQSRWKISSSVL